MSKGLCELYGLPAAELKQLLDQDLFAGLHPDDQPGVQADLTSFMNRDSSDYQSIYRIKLLGQEDYVLFADHGLNYACFRHRQLLGPEPGQL
ncbi:hypothetical protein ACXO3Q_01030 [Lactobacillus delbrueckii subsp. bulgaricus]|uniref:PAS domain-containing protein n=1 Tax=Lactobacillus delbrueckii TaxID=1584 RepID=UPI0020BEB8DD|nr:PAS domain-containing protein [Lactobacillus delbrueckii]